MRSDNSYFSFFSGEPAATPLVTASSAASSGHVRALRFALRTRGSRLLEEDR
jgi:hypothetical protein